MASNQPVVMVIGGGAAGFFCAIHVAKYAPRAKVVLLEKTNKLLSKVKISGGGRCNVTHACFHLAEMAQNYPRGKQFLKKAFHLFFTTDTIQWFEDRGVKLIAETDGRMFPITNDSQTIIDCLLNEARQYHVEIKTQTEVVGIQKQNDQFELKLKNGSQINADFVVVASGGFSKSSQFDWLRPLSLKIVEPVPSLFTFNFPKHPIRELMGVTVSDVQVKLNGTNLKLNGPLLITHWGLSGPVILRLSAWGARILKEKNWQFSIQINWLPSFNENSLRDVFLRIRKEKGRSKIAGKNEFGLPNRLWDFLLDESEVPQNINWADLPAKEQNKLLQNICAYTMEASGKTTFKEEFVTAGGVDLTEIEPTTMKSKKVNNLYFIGEVLDVDGITGGFNFQNAWTTGFIAAKNIIEQIK